MKTKHCKMAPPALHKLKKKQRGASKDVTIGNKRCEFDEHTTTNKFVLNFINAIIASLENQLS